MRSDLLDRDTLELGWEPDPSIIISLPARYWLGSKRDERGELQLFEGRAINISTEVIALTGPAQSWVGDRVIAQIEHFGRVEGKVTRLLRQRGFDMSISAAPQQRAKLADKIRWVEKFKNLEAPDQRVNRRFAPKDPASTLVLADGSRIPCLITDLSTSGAAVAADIRPAIGTTLAVGRIVGRVVRQLETGFAVRFVQLQDRQTVEALATRRGETRRVA
jgi:hypothetical protein